VSESRERVGSHPFLTARGPIGLAHRGGGREAPENSLTAFRNAQRLGFQYFETDVRATADGKVMVFHDATLNRVTGGVGRISALPYTEVRRAKIGGVDQILRLEELFEEFPDTFINIDVKDDQTVEPFLAMMKNSSYADRVCVASFGSSRLRTIRRALAGTVATALTPPEVAALVASSRLGPLARVSNLALPPRAQCVQVPVAQGGVPIVTQRFVDTAHRRGLVVHVWTIDDEVQMQRLFDLGVDGIVTDRPTVLNGVLSQRLDRGSLS
jgi:glycerophosphoryl diester phosphodiesterase